VIILTRLGGGLPVAVNPDLIERAEPTPDTVITMLDGHKLVVVESVEQVIGLIRDWRADVAASALVLAHFRRRQADFGDEPVPPAPAESPTAAPGDEAADAAAAVPLARVLRMPRKD